MAYPLRCIIINDYYPLLHSILSLFLIEIDGKIITSNTQLCLHSHYYLFVTVVRVWSMDLLVPIYTL